MTTSPTPKRPNKVRPKFIRLWPLWAVLALLLAGYFFLPSDSGVTTSISFVAKRGPLEITVLEGGNIEALESQEIKSEVQGETKILSIVDEGYYVTPDDVAEGKVLVELDSSKLLEEQIQQELQYQNALASLTQAREQYEIQMNQNASDVSEAELAVKFAQMDMSKYLGDVVAREIVAKVEAAAASVRADAAVQTAGASEPEAIGADAPVPAESSDEADTVQGAEPEQEQEGEEIEEPPFVPLPEIDYKQYADPDLLGDGEARQLLRKLENDLVLSEEEVGLAQTQLEGTQRLFDKEFVTKNDLENDQLKLKRQEINVESAETSKDLFITYEFPKQAEKLVADYVEAIRRLERIRKQAISKIAQDEARYHSAEAQFALQSRKKRELAEQIAACVIRATKPGLVVYGGGDNRGYRDNDQIQEGTVVRERQIIITIPDTTRMAANVKVHESAVNKIARGQRARIRIDAYPDVVLSGRVEKISVLPDSQNRWLNPDLKVYSTTVAIDGYYDWLKPGMSAETEIIIQDAEDVLQVPVQAIHWLGEQRVVYLPGLAGVEARPVETGLFNDVFIEITSGLEAGETVLLRAPSGVSPEKGTENRDRPGDDTQQAQAA